MMDIDLFEQGRDIFSNQYVILALTFAVFFFIKRLQRRTGWMLLNPILIAIVLIIIYLKITGVSFETYKTDWKSHTNLTHPGKYFRPSKVKIMRPTSPK